MDQYIGEIRIFAFNYTPEYWGACDGGTLSVSQNQALYSIIGGTYGEDIARKTFNLPNLQGLAPMGAGNGPGLTPRKAPTVVGKNTAPLSETQIPAHNHTLTLAISTVTTAKSGTPGPAERLTQPSYLGSTTVNIKSFAPGTTTPEVTLAPQTVNPEGQGAQHENQQPYLTMNFCIGLTGDYPIRS